MNKEMALLAALQRDIAARLRPICPDLSEASFDQLVRDIALVKLKYGVESELSPSLRRDLEQLVSDPSEERGDSNFA